MLKKELFVHLGRPLFGCTSQALEWDDGSKQEEEVCVYYHDFWEEVLGAAHQKTRNKKEAAGDRSCQGSLTYKQYLVNIF